MGFHVIVEREAHIVIQFHAAPPVPIDYPLLATLTTQEIDRARAAGYVADKVDVRNPVLRPGVNNYDDPPAAEDLSDWRTRMYVVWFCFIYENFRLLSTPLYAIEELILEFKGLDAIDYRLASLYAGVGSADPISPTKREKHLEFLKPCYDKAIRLIEEWRASHPRD